MIAIAAQSKASTQVKARWNAKTYKRYQIYLRIEEDAEIINFIEEKKKQLNTTEIFKNGIKELIKAEGK